MSHRLIWKKCSVSLKPLTPLMAVLVSNMLQLISNLSLLPPPPIPCLHHATRWPSSLCQWVTGAGITSASRGQPETASGRRTRMESVWAPGTTWLPGTQLNLEGWSSWDRSRWEQKRSLGNRWVCICKCVCVCLCVCVSVKSLCVFPPRAQCRRLRPREQQRDSSHAIVALSVLPHSSDSKLPHRAPGSCVSRLLCRLAPWQPLVCLGNVQWRASNVHREPLTHTAFVWSLKRGLAA